MALPPPSKWVPEQNLRRLAVLGKLIEENAELIKRSARCIIQGIDETDPTTGCTNRHNFQEEIADTMALCHVAIKYFDLNRSEIMERALEKEAHKAQWIAMLEEPTDGNTS